MTQNRWLKKCALVLFTWVFTVQSVLAQVPVNTQVPIRENIQTCAVYFSPVHPKTQKVYESVGQALSLTNNPADLRPVLERMIAENGLESFRGTHLSVTGVEMQDDRGVHDSFQNLLSDLGLDQVGMRVRVLSVPRAWIEMTAKKYVQYFTQHFKYLFYSHSRDYESPLYSEIAMGLLTKLPVEWATVTSLYLDSTLSTVESNVTAGVHISTVIFYSVFKKPMVNWLMRTTGLKFRGVDVGQFLKAGLTSLPFVLNFQISTQLSAIAKFYQTEGLPATLQAIPGQGQEFLAHQILTLMIQTSFYHFVVNKGVRVWENSKSDVRENTLARSVAEWNLAPLLMWDSFLLSMAARDANPLFTAGPIEVNLGQAVLLATTAAVGTFLALKPNFLDPTLRWYEAGERLIQKVKKNAGWRSMGVNRRDD